MSCDCKTNPCGCDSGITLPYLTGATGQDGIFGGFSAKWKYDSSTATSPASTFLRLNNATFSAVTQIYINDTNSEAIDYDAFLDSFSNGGAFGTIRIWKQFDSSKFWLGTVSSVVDNGTDHTIGVTHIGSNGSFTASDSLVVSFTNNGATGSTGATGSAGTNAAQVIDVDFSGSIAASTAGPVSLSTLTIPANQLDTDKDYLEFSAYVTFGNTINNSVNNIYISIGDQGRVLDTNERFIQFKENGIRGLLIRGTIIRESNLLAHCVTSYDITYTSNGNVALEPFLNTKRMFNHQSIAINWTQTNLLDIGFNNGTTTEIITLQHFEVKHVQKI